jgi:hypothetical protein
MKLRIVEQNPTAATKAPIPGCLVTVKMSQNRSQLARYETSAITRPIEIKSGRVVITARPGASGVASSFTLESPRPGPLEDGGNDESILEIVSMTPHAHTISAVIGGKQQKIKFTGGIGSNLKLMAFAGSWHSYTTHGVSLS